MKIMPLIPITDTNLVSTTVTDFNAVYNVATTYALGDKITYENPSIPVTITIASPCVITWSAHEFTVGTPVRFTTTGALPTGITSGVTYFISAILTVDTFTISDEFGRALDIRTSGSQSGVHTLTAQMHKTYISLQAANTGNSPRKLAGAAWWQDAGASNKWAMFDGSVTSQSVASSITVRITPNIKFNTISLQNLKGSSCRIRVNNGSTDTYDVTHSLVTSAWSSTSGPDVLTERKQNLVVTGLTTMSLPSIGYFEITLTDSVTTWMCAIGALLVGRAIDIGQSQYEASIGVQNYSLIEQDSFGNYSITPRTFSKKGSFDVWILNTEVSMIFEKLAGLGSTACLYIGSDGETATVIYGFAFDWNIILRYTAQSVLRVEVKGLS